MNWTNIKLVFQREIVDQLRDRRTLFTILVLPLILYPLLGMGLLQTAQFMRKAPSEVWLIGSENLPQQIPLVRGDKFAPGLAGDVSLDLLTVRTYDGDHDFLDQDVLQMISKAGVDENNGTSLDDETRKWIQHQMGLRKADVLVVVPDGFLDHASENTNLSSIPAIQLFVNSAKDKSALAGAEVNRIISSWRAKLIEAKFIEKDLPFSLAFPFAIEPNDIVDSQTQKAAVWAKILPFVVMLWALTGAFYPAIDLCAGEKERGTLETLLSSPAARSEIVVGKMFTIMVFSVSNAILNLFSMTITGLLVIQHIGSAMPVGGPGEISLPPITTLPWVIIGLLPVAAMFSALALALASFARSSKEGQYYLIPLLMLLLPLMMLSILPTTTLDLGTSFIPVTGMMLLLRNMIEGNHALVLQYAGPVLATTIVCCYLSVRWAVNQFNNENVLFRASEQFGIGIWFKQVLRDRQLKPSVGQAILCLIMILIIKFFMGMAVSAPQSWADFAKQIFVVQVATIAVPTILMAAILTRSPRITLRLKPTRVGVLCAAMLLGILFYPLLALVGQLVMQVYPPSVELQQLEKSIVAIVDSAPGIVAILLVVALVPAVCEELAFRGFILSGLESIRGKWTAVLLSSLFFGATHAVFQQSIMAFITGVILGLIALRTSSILPCILFHMTHNGMTVLTSRLKGLAAEDSYFRFAFQEVSVAGQTHTQFSPLAVVIMTTTAILLFAWLWKQKDDQAGSSSPVSPASLSSATTRG